MSILLISAPNDRPFYATPQLGVFRIGHYLEKAGLACDIFDPNIDKPEQWQRKKAPYSIIAVSGNNVCMHECLDLVRHFASLQETRPLLVAGGITPTYNYEDWLESGVDAVILGYGEEPMLALGRAAETNVGKWADVFSNIKGLAFQGPDGLVKINPAEPLTAELFTSLTYENMYDIEIPYQQYWDINSSMVQQLSVDNHDFIVKTVRLFTSSQCPNRCGYCPSKFLSKAQGFAARRLSLTPEQSLELIRESYERHGCDLIFFNDEEFLCDRKTVKALCRLIIEDKSKNKLPEELRFQCQSRAVDFLCKGEVDRELLEILELAGFNRISLGVENICERLLATPIMNKAQYNSKDIENIVSAFRETSIALTLNFMLLVPESSFEELRRNCEAILALLQQDILLLINLYIMAAPGAPAYESGSYEIATRPMISPLNNKELMLPAYFVPQDKRLREGLKNLDKLIEEELDEFLKNVDSDNDCISTTIRGIILCQAVLKMMAEKELYSEFKLMLRQKAKAMLKS